jgi:hypothetical protein
LPWANLTFRSGPILSKQDFPSKTALLANQAFRSEPILPRQDYPPNIYTALQANPTSLLFLDEDLGSLHFLFTTFYFFLNYTWVLSKSKLIAF